MRCKLVFLLLSALAISASSFATPDYMKAFEKITSSKIECAYCHDGKPPKRNPFGKAIGEALNNSNDGLITAAMIKALEPADSDGDGISNGEEMAAKSKPGDPASKPAPKTETAEPATEELAPLVPKHSFHPILVHFPVALLIVAAFFEIASRKKKDDGMHTAAVLCTGVGVIGSIASLISGIIAWQRLGYTLEGTLLIHFVLAILCTIAGILAYAQRQKPSFVVILTISAILVGVAGHFGGELVYG